LLEVSFLQMYDVSMSKFESGRGHDGRKDSKQLGPFEFSLLQSFTSRNVEMWARLLKTGNARHVLRSPGSEFRKQLFSSLQATDVEKIGLDELRQITSMLSGLFDMGLLTEQRLRISIERCVVALQERAPQDAMRLALDALEAQVPCGSTTILSTVSKGVKLSANIGELEKGLELTRCGFEKKVIQANDPRAISVFNVILAVTCDPLLCPPGSNQRVGPCYQGDRTLRDVAHRMRIGAGFAEIVAANGVRFVSSSDERRINLAVMALVQVGTSLFLEGQRLTGKLAPARFQKLMDRIEIGREYPVPGNIEELGEDWRTVSMQLLDGALQVALHCFTATELPDGSFEFGLQYAIRGETINRLAAALECAIAAEGVAGQDRVVDDISTLIFCALKVPQCRKEIPRGCVHSALQLAALDEAEPIRRAERVRAILHVGLDKVGDTHLLAELVTVLAEALNQDPSLEDAYIPLVDSIDQRIEELNAERVRKHSAQKRKSNPPPATGSEEHSKGWFSRLLDDHTKDPNL
jgi:hypothetical protein